MDELNEIRENQEVESEDTSFGNDVIEKPFNPNDIEIETPPFTVGYLIDSIRYGEINMNTDFQRESNLWSSQRQSRLIESILLGLPLPAFYFDTTGKPWDIIDGLQRCCAIENFCIKKTLKLTGLEFLGKKEGGESDYLNNLGFEDLPLPLQTSIIRRQIVIFKLKKAPLRVRYHLFKRLNTGGLELTPQEIRNAIFQGKASDTVKNFAQFDVFKKATDGKIKTQRMEDRDFVSRFIAFYLINYTEYQPGLDDFINSSMEIIEKTEDTQKIENDFKKSLLLSIDIFGTDAFRKRTNENDARHPINKAYFEVITSTFAKLNDDKINRLKRHKTLFRNNLIELMKNVRYSNSLSQGTGTADSVKIRFSWFHQVLEKSINGIEIKITDDNKIEDSELQIA
ncbi:MAG: DUF262 domain-containing protein [Tannerella sp.]|jgi:hypothetical protein|nr:DUF262 domain-containing protein [Tannerella sp.]